jgi:coproporphyrinogen III oxidase-like Fe-S oxidoreductase
MQDFNPEVQLAIGRWQPYEEVVRAVTRLDEAGLERIGFDLMYGLPHQGEREITLNAARAASLWPDRMAVFGYAHVPWLKSHQRRIDTAALPGAAERLEQAELTGRLLQGAGYEPVGLDHFALPHDDLAVAAAPHAAAQLPGLHQRSRRCADRRRRFRHRPAAAGLRAERGRHRRLGPGGESGQAPHYAGTAA